MDLSGFKEYNLSNGLPTMTISKNGISFSQTAVIRLRKPEFAEILINSVDEQVVVRAASKDNPNSAPFFKTNKKIISVRWNYKDLIQTFEELMNWNVAEHTYKVEGSFSIDDNLILFDLRKFQEIK